MSVLLLGKHARKPSMRCLTAVHHEGLAGDERGGRRTEEQHGAGNLLRSRRPPDRAVDQQPFLDGRIRQPSFGHRCRHEPGGHRVHADATGRVIERGCLGETHHPMLGGGIGRHAGISDHSRATEAVFTIAPPPDRISLFVLG